MARSFGAGGEYINIAPNAIFDGNSFSVAFRWRTSTAGQWEVLSKHQAATSFNGWIFSSSNGSPNRMQWNAKAGSGGAFGCVDASVNASDGNWHSAVGRAIRTSSGTFDLMVDGTAATQATGTAAFDPTAQPFRIGRGLDTFWSEFIGDVEDVAFWNAYLTNDESRAFCRGASPGSIRPENLKLWLPLGR